MGLLATFMQCASLVFTNASIWQMLRGSIIIFAALIRFLYLRKRTQPFEIVGIVIVVVALCVVGLASIYSPSPEAAVQSTALEKIAGVLLILGAQATQGLQMVVEEKLLHDVEADPMFIVAAEGFWGLLFTTCIFMPLAQFALKGTGTLDGSGIYENCFPEDFWMPLHSGRIALFSFSYMVFVMLYNMTGMMITEMTQATTRQVLDAGRTLGVWATFVLIGGNMGEPLGWYSWIEAGGFVLLVAGMFVYYRVVELPYPGLYPAEGLQRELLASPDVELQNSR